MIVSVKNRLAKLTRRLNPNGACVGCGYRPGDIRTVEICIPKLDDMDALPDEVTSPADRPLCPVCGGYMPPIAIVYAHEDKR